MPVELHCLGPLDVRVDGGPAPADLLWRKNLALLVYLARSPRGRAREHLMGLLWADKDQDKARHSLNEALRVLRSVLGDGLITEGDVVRLDPGAFETDLQPFEPERIAGAFLEGFTVPDAPEFEDWLAREREQVRVAALGQLTALAEAALAEGALRRAREAAERAQALDPHHEPTVRVLMRAYALDGVRQLALEVYQRSAALLQRDLGAEPDAETRRLVARLRAGDVVPANSPVPEPDQTVPLVGRGRSALARLVELWSQARDGAGARLAVLRGDAGTGKTRLADEVAARARLDGGVVAGARALENDGLSAVLAAWLRAGLAVPELGGAAPAALAALAAVDPDLVLRFPGARTAAPLPLPDAMVGAVAAVAIERPVLLVLDDAHRASPVLHEAIARLLQRAGGGGGGSRARLLVLLAVSPRTGEALDTLRERLGRDLKGEEIASGTLVEQDVAELVAWAFPGYSPEENLRLARRIMADTAGNPFLATQLVLALRAGLAVTPAAGPAWPAAHRTLDDTLPSDLPPAVAAALRLRYRALSPSAQRVLSAVAVLGERTSEKALARAAELATGELDQALDQLEWERWLRCDAQGYAFVTRLAREVILADMVTGGERRRIQERAEGAVGSKG